MKVTLVSAGVSRGEYPQFARFMPMTAAGIHYVASALPPEMEVEIINQTNDGLTNKQVVDRINYSSADAVLFNQFYSTRGRIRDMVSGLSIDAIIGVGGHDATFDCTDSLSKYSDFDFVWQGEADTNLGRYLKSFRKTGATQIFNNLENRVQDLDELPILNHDDYSGDVGFLVTSRGCYRRGCDFCTTPKMYPDGWKARSVAHVKKELENLANAGKKYIFFTDDNFAGFSLEQLRRADQILSVCSELDLKILFFSIKEQIIRAGKEGYLEKWKGTVFRVHTGVENADECAIQRLGKVGSDSEYELRSTRAISALYNNGIAPFLGYVNFNPHSTLEQLKNSAIFLAQYAECADFAHLRQGLRFYPGTLSPESFGLSTYTVRNGDFFYEFKDSRVQRLYEFLWNIPDESLKKVSNLLYTVTDILYVNQYHETNIGEKYWNLKKEIGKSNYEFFNYALDIFEKGLVVGQSKLSDFTAKTGELLNRLTELSQELHEQVEYK